MWIKICGLNESGSAREIAALAPDAIGLNFYEKSPRFVSSEMACSIAAALPPGIRSIGVFAEPTAAAIRAAVTGCRLSGVQVHDAAASDALFGLDELLSQPGDVNTTTSSLIPEAGARIRAFQIGPTGLAAVADYVEMCRRRNVRLDACLVDAHVDGRYGGTGQSPSWTLLRDEYRTHEWPPLILAGGLRPENVAEAIEVVRPFGVDVASGVESSPGIKDVSRVARFIEEARRAFARIGAGATL